MNFARSFYERICRAPADDGGGGGGGAGGAGGGAGGAGDAGASPPGGTGGAGDWSVGLDEYKPLLTTRGWAGKPIGEVMPAVLKSYSELEGLVGTSAKIPGKDAKPEEWAAFNKKLGAPESADKYVLPKLDAGDYSEGDKAFHAAILPEALKAGLTQRQLDTLAPAFNNFAQAQRQARDETAKSFAAKSAQELTAEWGGEEGFKASMDLANSALRTVFGDQVPAWVGMRLEDGSFLGDSPMVARAFAKLGKQLQEEGVLVTGQQSGGGGGNDAARHLEEIYAGARADPKHPYTDRAHPQHAATVDKVMRLTMQIAGGEG